MDKAEKISPHELVVYSTDVELISACLRLTQVGTVYHRAPRPDYVSPNGKMAFAKKDSWSWNLKYATQLIQLLPQITPYLTRKKILAKLSVPISGSSCHPVHFEGKPAPGVSDEQRERNWATFFKENAVDPRAIKRHHKWKPGHEPDHEHPDSGWRTLNIKWEGEKAPPDQRHLLKGGPESGIPCEQCNEMTRIVGEMDRQHCS